MLIFHPGAFKYGSAALMTAEEDAARQRGFEPVSVEYRGHRQVGLPYSKRLSRRYARQGRVVVTFGESAGGSLADIGHLTLLVQDYADLPAIDGYWKRTFPDPNDRPARQVMKLGTQGRSHVQFHVLAAI